MSLDSNQINTSYFYWHRRNMLNLPKENYYKTLAINLNKSPFNGNVSFFLNSFMY